jgi:hypothetical protein
MACLCSRCLIHVLEQTYKLLYYNHIQYVWKKHYE